MAAIDLELFELPALTLSHHDAAEGLEQSVAAMPAGIVGGDATPRLLAILESVCNSSDDLALLNRAVAGQLAHIVTNFDGTEREVAASFGRFTGPGQGDRG